VEDEDAELMEDILSTIGRWLIDFSNKLIDDILIDDILSTIGRWLIDLAAQW
jgi:hypothetical protein